MRNLLGYFISRTYWSRYTRLTGDTPGEYLVIWRQRGRRVWDCTEARLG